MRENLFKKFDWILFFSMMLLITIGIFVIYSTSIAGSEQSDFYKKQIISALLGLVLFFIVWRLDHKLLGTLSPLMYIVSILFLIVTIILGSEARGSTRWLDIGGLRLQPSELAKPALVIFLASYFTKHNVKKLKHFLISLLILGIPLLLVFKQPDLGTSIVLFFIWLAITFAAGARLLHLFSLGALFLGAFPFLWHFLKDYQKDRLLSFMNPEVDPLGTSYNLIQAVIAVGSGQLTGRGFGRGTQSHLNFLPEQHTDFIFATLSEELGFVGGVLLLVLFGILLYRLIKISQIASDSLGSLIGFGIAIMVLIQVFVNVGMNMALLPVTGITLPFVSFGGSSLISMMISIGVMQSIFRYKKEAS